jgi:outer membrane lipoprotein SlyB
MKVSLFKNTASVLALAVALSGCTRNISSSNYTAASVGEAMTTYQGTIINVRKVSIQEGDKLSDNTGGMVVGGLLGGVGGHMIGKGHGNTAATVGGALLGATAGAFAQRALSEQEGLEYSVKLTNGNIMTVVQGLDNPMAVGQRVLVQVSNQGRSRVVPDASPVQDVQPMPNTQTIVIKK